MNTENITSNAVPSSPTPTEHSMHCSMMTSPAGNVSSSSTLNNDCLVEVFKQLQTNDLILICLFCEHCLDLIKSQIFPYRKINADDVFKVYDIRGVFAEFGSNISDLIIHRRHIEAKTKTKSDSQQLLEMLTRNCANDSLKKLNITLNFHDIDASCIESFARKLQDVCNLTITASHYHSGQQQMVNTIENNRKMEILLQKVEKLQTIRINMMPICGGFLNRTPIEHLTHLALVQCEQIHANALVDGAANFKCLSTFVWQNSKFEGIESVSDNIFTVCDILGCEFGTVEAVTIHMNYALKYCNGNGERSILSGLKRMPQLKSLSIGVAGACACNNFYDVIQQLVQLESFAIESPLVFGGRSCLPCEKVIGNYLPKICDKLRNLTNFRIVRVNPQQTEYFFNEIMDKLKHLEELHLIGIRQFNEENLLSLVRNIPKLKILLLNETRFNFTKSLYANLVSECQNRHMKIVVSANVRRTLLTHVATKYRKEFVQIAAD